MHHFAFGQPFDAIVQMAFMVEDIHQAMADWTRHYKVGPFFLNENYVGENALYRGAPDKTAISVAMGFSGHMQIELIEVLTPGPSIYQEAIDRSGYGFHHVGIVSVDFEADMARLAGEGFITAMSGSLPGTGWNYAYVEKPGSLPGFVELIPEPMVSRMMTPIYRASIGWNGKDPVRRMR